MKEKLCFIFGGLFRVALRPRRMGQILNNFFLDVKYAGAYLGIPLSNENKEEGFTNTTSTEYYVLNELFSKLSMTNDDVIVDVGCGSGRVLGWLTAKYPQNKVLGVEIDPNVAASTRKRMRPYPQVEIVSGSALDRDIVKKGTIFYLFHPFHELPMRQFIALLKEQVNLGQIPVEKLVIVYHNCCCLNVFEEDPVWKIERYGDINGLPTAIVSLA